MMGAAYIDENPSLGLKSGNNVTAVHTAIITHGTQAYVPCALLSSKSKLKTTKTRQLVI
jgi:hypothetical protein